MLVNQIPKEKVSYCIEKLFSLFDPFNEHDLKKLKRALYLYRNGAVYNVTLQDETIKATILDDGVAYEIELEVDFIEISYCDCGNADDIFCVHKLAALFYVFSLYDSPGEFYNKWKNRRNPILNKNKQPIQKQQLQFSQDELPYAEDSLESWLSYFDENYELFKKKQDQKKSFYWSYNRDTSLVSNIFEEFYPTLLDAPKPSSEFGKILFNTHAAITTIEKILESISDGQTSIYAHQNIRKYISELTKEIAELIQSIHSGNLIPSDLDEKIISKTPERMMDLLLLSRDFQYERFYLFQISCSILPDSKIWMDELEQKFLIRMQKEEKLKSLGKINFSSECRLALAHFSFLKEDDKETINKLANGDSREVYFYTTWIKTLAKNKRWSRFEAWLPFIEERMGTYIHQYGDQQLKRELANFYLFFIKQYSQEKGIEDIYINTLQTWLPYSYYDFSEYLLDKKAYREWTELHIFSGLSIQYIELDLLKKIEEVDRACLLPLYHNAVEELINLKNRDAYRQAVKYLRKLRMHYRALKKEQVWDSYIIRLSSKYKRLRAFQEELRKGKGKLIND